MISVALIDDHAITRRGIKTIIELNPEIKVVLEASNGRELLDKLKSDPAQDLAIAIVDIHMPGMNGFELTQELHKLYPSLKIIAFTLVLEEDAIINMITSGACGYISKSADPAILAEAIITVYRNGFYLGDLVKKEYFRNSTTGKKRTGFNGKQHLSPKELQFVRMAATNLTYKEIADQMDIRPKTLENYRDSIFQKLDIKNRAALALYAIKNGIIDIF